LNVRATPLLGSLTKSEVSSADEAEP